LHLRHAIIVELTGPSLSLVTPMPWARCGSPSRPARVERAAASARALLGSATPVLTPTRAVYASTSPTEAASFLSRYFGGEIVASAQPLPGAGNGTCYLAKTLRWEHQSDGSAYELTWIHAPRLRQRPLTLRAYEKYLTRLHGNLSVSQYDEYMDNHVALTFDDADPAIDRLRRDGTPFFMRGQYGEFADVFVEGPGGQIYELLAHRQTRVKTLPEWNLCGPL
jgi:hypothetical protein